MILFVAGFSLTSVREVIPAHAQDSERSLEDAIRSKVEAGQIDAALDQARRAVGQYPNSSTLCQLLGAALFKKGLNEGARTAFRRAIELEQGNLDRAEDFYGKGIRLKPEAFQAHYGLGRALLAKKQLAAAGTELRRALELKPDDVEAHYALARAYQQMGDKELAQREFAVCAQINARRQSVSSGVAGKQP